MPKRALAVAALLAFPLGPALANPPQETERAGRYTLQPIDGGYLRLDSESGAMSLCTKQGATLACEPVRDERQANRDLEALAAENQALKNKIKRLEDRLAAGDRAPADGKAGGKSDRNDPKFKIPSEEEVDKAMDYIDRMIRKFRDKLRDLDSGGGKGTPL